MATQKKNHICQFLQKIAVIKFWPMGYTDQWHVQLSESVFKDGKPILSLIFLLAEMWSSSSYFGSQVDLGNGNQAQQSNKMETS